MSIKRRWQLLAIVLTTCFAVLAGNSMAFAASPPNGESSSYNPENYTSPSGSQAQVYAQGTVSETRNIFGWNLLVWHGQDNNDVWVSYRNGTAYAMPGTTYVAPRVATYGTGYAMFETGTDNRIYWTYSTTSAPTSSNDWVPWMALPGQSTMTAQVAVTHVGPATSTELYVAYLSSAGDHYIYGSYWTGTVWLQAQIISNGQSNSPPTLAYDPEDSEILIMIRGLNDNQNYMNRQPYGGGWEGWVPVGGTTYNTPAIAATNTGWIEAADLGTDDHVWYETIDPNLNASGWSQDLSTGWTATSAPNLSEDNDTNQIFTDFSGAKGDIWWKQSFQG